MPFFSIFWPLVNSRYLVEFAGVKPAAIFTHPPLSIPSRLLRLRGETPRCPLFRLVPVSSKTMAPRALFTCADELALHRQWCTAVRLSSLAGAPPPFSLF
jgi:hypothetical protein